VYAGIVKGTVNIGVPVGMHQHKSTRNLISQLTENKKLKD